MRFLKNLDAVAVENPAAIGTPDINYIGGWIECKWLRQWPKREDTPVILPHPYTKQQQIWGKRRMRRGGICLVMLQCRQEWLLFDACTASEFLGTLPRRMLYEASFFRSVGLTAEIEMVLKDETRLRGLIGLPAKVGTKRAVGSDGNIP